DAAVAAIGAIQREARGGFKGRPRWPMIVLRSPKGWTGPRIVDDKPVENTWRSHQVPLDGVRKNPVHMKQLEEWMRSYHADELFEDGRLRADLRGLAPEGARRMSANPHANGGLLLRDLDLPDFRRYAVAVPQPGTVVAEATRRAGEFLRDVMQANASAKNFR